MTSQITKGVDHVFYDIVMTNPSNKLKQATFVENKNQDILAKASDYYMSVVRFSIPGYTIPLRVMKTALDPLVPNKLAYTVTLRYLTDDYQVNLVWVPESNLAVPGDVVSTQPNSFQYYSLYSVKAFVKMVNTAFSTAWSLLNTDHAGVVASEPYIVYNSETQLMSLCAPVTYATAPVEIYMNSELFFFFNSFDNVAYENATNGKDYKIDFGYTYEDTATSYNLFNPPAGNPGAGQPHYRVVQDYQVMYNWNSVKAIVFTTGSIPIRYEFQPVFNQDGIQLDTGSLNYKPIVTDFVPIVQNGFENRSTIIYNPTAEYRRIDLTSEMSLRKFDMQIFWQDNDLRMYPVYIGPQDLISVKILFERRK